MKKPRGIYVYGVWLKRDRRWYPWAGFGSKRLMILLCADINAGSPDMRAVVKRVYVAPPKEAK